MGSRYPLIRITQEGWRYFSHSKFSQVPESEFGSLNPDWSVRSLTWGLWVCTSQFPVAMLIGNPNVFSGERKVRHALDAQHLDKNGYHGGLPSPSCQKHITHVSGKYQLPRPTHFELQCALQTPDLDLMHWENCPKKFCYRKNGRSYWLMVTLNESGHWTYHA